MIRDFGVSVVTNVRSLKWLFLLPALLLLSNFLIGQPSLSYVGISFVLVDLFIVGAETFFDMKRLGYVRY